MSVRLSRWSKQLATLLQACQLSKASKTVSADCTAPSVICLPVLFGRDQRTTGNASERARGTMGGEVDNASLQITVLLPRAPLTTGSCSTAAMPDLSQLGSSDQPGWNDVIYLSFGNHLLSQLSDHEHHCKIKSQHLAVNSFVNSMTAGVRASEGRGNFTPEQAGDVLLGK